MSELSLTSVDESFTVFCYGEMAPVSASLDDRVQEIWNDARRSRPQLFDGLVLCVGDLNTITMNCHPVPYRYIYAQETDTRVRSELNLRAAAVSGVVHLNGNVLVGERSSDVTQGVGKLELVPSGGLPAIVGSIDYREQLLVELSEEVYIARQCVASVSPFAVIEDQRNRVVDICCEIVLKDVAQGDVLKNFQPGEYRALHCLSSAEIDARIQAAPDSWLPISALLVDYLFGGRQERPVM